MAHSTNLLQEDKDRLFKQLGSQLDTLRQRRGSETPGCLLSNMAERVRPCTFCADWQCECHCVSHWALRLK